ncbi:aminoglycoside phosphotransferase family protein [Shewanella saliphila]|uniref:Cell wall phosphotransferase n=1 Tax=Shewanella saliphila TaxID=2282698 RepID=A0ABQ2QAT6_9GAMM|nr:phosphotransferase [Shewanella saliphila]MCL1100622.1 phosphotransferase [Shewanella saliphila]GGP61690.1 cell wall phosphotransferase [Shewanella saliphila]
MSLSDPRFVALSHWLNHYFEAEVTPSLICGDASFRRYFRIQHFGKHYIVSDSPIHLVPIAPFVAIAKAYHAAGLCVPEVLATCNEQGFVLQTDVGEQQLLSVLNLQNVVGYYQQALNLLPTIASVTDTELGPLIDYDGEFVQRELMIFIDWLVNKHIDYRLTNNEQQMINATFAALTDSAMSQPKVGMHRDYHSRNLLINADELAVIDFQDAVLGPITYDAVSLLRDCYVRWPDGQVQQLMQYHYQLIKQHKLLGDEVDFTTYQQWFDLMGLQRHIKAAGIFARLYHRDGKRGYLADIPLTLQYIVDIGVKYPQITEFSGWVKTVIAPLVEQTAVKQQLDTTNTGY